MALNKKYPQFAIIQWGARLHYAAPEALAKANMLKILYTDFHRETWPLFSNFSSLLKQFAPSFLKRAQSRDLPASISRNNVRSFPYYNFQQAVLSRLHPTGARAAAKFGIGSQGLARELIKKNFENADGLYVTPCTSTDAVKLGRSKNLFIVIETISMPFHKLIELDEYRRYGAKPPRDENELQDDIQFFKDELVNANLILVASDHVKQGVIDLGFSSDNIAKVPYGLESSNSSSCSKPVPGRLLYVGKIGYLKGVHYFAEACRILEKRKVNFEARAVGPCPDGVNSRSEFLGLNYTGQIPRSEVVKEYVSADIFIFPTLSDGFGLVMLEAMASGIPVIATSNCADLIVDGENGFIIQSRNAEEIADRVQLLIENRKLRKAMGQKAQKTAQQNDIDRYASRLTQVIAKKYTEFRSNTSKM